MKRPATQGTTADDVLVYAKRLIADFGWQRLAWSEYGPRPRCIRAAIWCAAKEMGCLGTSAHGDALRRVSEAIYGRGSVGGIIDYEHYKSTNKDSVIALLQTAIEMGPSERELNGTVWPV